MRLLFFLLFSILSVVPGALTSPATDKFERYQSISRSAPIDLDDSLFDDLTSKPRDYHAAVILTAAEARFGCVLCREVQPEWDLIAQSWNKGANPDGLKLLFGTLDFSNGKGTFQKVCLYQRFADCGCVANIRWKLLLQTAPVLLLFPPTVGPHARVDSTPFRFDFNRWDISEATSMKQLLIYFVRAVPFPPTNSIHGSSDTCLRVRSRLLFAPSTTRVLFPRSHFQWGQSLFSRFYHRMFYQLFGTEISGPHSAWSLFSSLQVATCSIKFERCPMLLVMAKEASATLPGIFRCSLAWRRK